MKSSLVEHRFEIHRKESYQEKLSIERRYRRGTLSLVNFL
jgi:hypothetical protein